MLVDYYYYYQSGLSTNIMDWQKIFVPSKAVEALKGEMPDCKEVSERIVQSIYKSLTSQVRVGSAYYDESQCTLLGLVQICNVDGYVGYANKKHVEFSNGYQFYRPNLPVEVLIWIGSILDEIQIWPLDLYED